LFLDLLSGADLNPTLLLKSMQIERLANHGVTTFALDCCTHASYPTISILASTIMYFFS
jgi:hypothetical protein